MIKNCYDLLHHMQENTTNGVLRFTPDTAKKLNLSDDLLDTYAQQLVDMGYAKRQLRGIFLTPDGWKTH